MNINKKITAGLCALVTTTMPIVVVISCGSKKDTMITSKSNVGVSITDKNDESKDSISPYSKEDTYSFVNNHFSKKLIPTQIKGAIAQTSGRFNNPVFPTWYKGQLQDSKHDIVLENQKAEQIIKDSLEKDGYAYLVQDDKLGPITNIAEKGFLKLGKYQYYGIASWTLKEENAKNNKQITNGKDVNNIPKTDIKITPKKVGNITYNTGDAYYAAAKRLKGEGLFDKLHAIQGQHQVHRRYGQLYDTYKKAFLDDIYDNDNKTFIDIYSEDPTGKDPYNYIIGHNGENYHDEGDMYNREHVIPQSWFDKKSHMRNDAQFVWPTDGKVSGMRSNYPHAPANNLNFISQNGSKLGSNSAYGGTAFEPIDECKDDIARAYLYFSLSYYESIVPHAQAKKVFSNAFPFIRENYLKLYIKWAKEDPVDKFDIQRNRKVAKIQGNRNPFIDYPELIDEIWGKNGDGNPIKTFSNNGMAVEIQ